MGFTIPALVTAFLNSHLEPGSYQTGEEVQGRPCVHLLLWGRLGMLRYAVRAQSFVVLASAKCTDGSQDKAENGA